MNISCLAEFIPSEARDLKRGMMPEQLDIIINGLRKDIRVYFRSILLCIVLWILVAIMIPSWRQPWDIGYRILFFCLFVLPIFPIIVFHFIIFYKVAKFCSLVKKNIILTVLYLAVSLIAPFGALLVPGIVITEYKKRFQ